jgi:hypothetical protein
MINSCAMYINFAGSWEATERTTQDNSKLLYSFVLDQEERVV